MKRGIKLQKDENGIEGVATPKHNTNEGEKEIKVGKRLAASKLRQFDYGDNPSKSAVKEEHKNNCRNLTVNTNAQESWCGFGPVLVEVAMSHLLLCVHV